MAAFLINGDKTMWTKILRKVVRKIEDRNDHCTGDGTGGTGSGHCT